MNFLTCSLLTTSTRKSYHIHNPFKYHFYFLLISNICDTFCQRLNQLHRIQGFLFSSELLFQEFRSSSVLERISHGPQIFFHILQFHPMLPRHGNIHLLPDPAQSRFILLYLFDARNKTRISFIAFQIINPTQQLIHAHKLFLPPFSIRLSILVPGF